MESWEQGPGLKREQVRDLMRALLNALLHNDMHICFQVLGPIQNFFPRYLNLAVFVCFSAFSLYFLLLTLRKGTLPCRNAQSSTSSPWRNLNKTVNSHSCYALIKE